jgi:oligopeptide/dipeptide ABC transporter ATP-binding protein
MYEADEGTILFRDRLFDVGSMSDVGRLRGKELKNYRGKVKYVFQDPARSLNPRMTIFDVLISGKRWAGTRIDKKVLREEAAAVLEEVGLSASDLERRPAEFSGGQRQRISIARGLLMNPELLICDEVVSALDVSIQGQILNFLLDIRSRRDLSFLFIAHDLKVACYFCDRIGVMYRGELMEEAPAEELYREGLHPYTRLLFSSVSGKAGGAATQGSTEQAGELRGEVKTAVTEIAGCAFADRCPLAEGRCFAEHPVIKEIDNSHKVRCFKVPC